jgi:hypothetical protein
MILIKRESASRWYLPSGKPFHEVERADGKGMRSSTLRDAVKWGLIRASPTFSLC